MSLGTIKSRVLNDASATLYAANIPLIVAASNQLTVSSYDVSPAGAPHTFAVAASDQTDTAATFTSLGPCVSRRGHHVCLDWRNQCLEDNLGNINVGTARGRCSGVVLV
ncbi:hypothetical protein EDD21DRAFT_156244 [Dissophora ornata]|nr:hypothetical protein EDD21DRAFT_156244 [Dissophora ornata]